MKLIIKFGRSVVANLTGHLDDLHIATLQGTQQEVTQFKHKLFQKQVQYHHLDGADGDTELTEDVNANYRI